MHLDMVRPHAHVATPKDLQDLLRFISMRWSELVRSNYGLLSLAIDPKWPFRAGEKWIVYVRGENPIEIEKQLNAMNPRTEMEQIEIRVLPDNAVTLPRQGALYQPYPYVVPGGRFQEMYAWDSYFAFLGLLLDGKVRLAQNMVDNQLYQVEHYGAVLNGNRSYYTTRSQLPFLGDMVLRTFQVNDDHQWLARAAVSCEQFHAYYTSGGHNVEGTGLQRFFDFGPPGSAPPEADMHEKDKDGKTPHDRVKAYYRANYQSGIDDYDIADMYDFDKDELTAKYFDSDRAMRESGFDTSGRFGKFGANCLAYLPVCLNSLLYHLEQNIADIHAILANANSSQRQRHTESTTKWRQTAEIRKEAIVNLCWDAEDGLFYDYDHTLRKRRKYVFGTTFLPLWVGLASDHQAKRVTEVAMEKLSYPGGLSTSDRSLDTQWDCPFGWAPLQIFAVEGMRRYGYKSEAARIAINFSSCVLKCWLSTGEIWEKYDLLRRSEIVRLKFGYDTNEPGFAWSNAAVALFMRLLSDAEKEAVLQLDGIGAHANAF